LAIASLLLIGLAWTGIRGGIHQFPQSQTPGQIVQTLTQLGFGIFALLSVLTTFWGARWNRFMLAGWTVTATLAGGLAPVVWGGTSRLIGFVSGAAALLVALGIAWLLRIGARSLTSA
jgi:hypothetical protein